MKQLLCLVVCIFITTVGAQQNISDAERQLDSMIQAALSKNDFKRAEELAINERQRAMIAEYKRSKRPTKQVCTYSSADGKSGVMVCRDR